MSGMDEFTRQVLGCIAWGTIALMFALFCMNLLVVLIDDLRVIEGGTNAADAPDDPAGQAATGMLGGTVYTAPSGARLAIDPLTALVGALLALAPVFAGLSLFAAGFAPLWMQQVAGVATCCLAIGACCRPFSEALEHAGLVARVER